MYAIEPKPVKEVQQKNVVALRDLKIVCVERKFIISAVLRA